MSDYRATLQVEFPDRTIYILQVLGLVERSNSIPSPATLSDNN